MSRDAGDFRANGIYKDPWMQCKVSIELSRSIVDECDHRDLKKPGKEKRKKGREKSKRDLTMTKMVMGYLVYERNYRRHIMGG